MLKQEFKKVNLYYFFEMMVLYDKINSIFGEEKGIVNLRMARSKCYPKTK
jgi:hypothetical protein